MLLGRPVPECPGNRGRKPQAQAQVKEPVASEKQLELDTLRMSLERKGQEIDAREAELNKRAQSLADKETLINNQLGGSGKRLDSCRRIASPWQGRGGG